MRSQQLSPHLTTGEVTCRDGCGYGLAAAEWPPELPAHFELMRYLVGRPLYVTSGARCEIHNANSGGKENSAHRRLHALDLAASGGRDRIELILATTIATSITSAAISPAEGLELYRKTLAAIRGLGIARGFIHVDLDDDLPRPAAWTY